MSGHCEGSMYKEHKGVIPAVRSSSHHNGHLPSCLPEAHSSIILKVGVVQDIHHITCFLLPVEAGYDVSMTFGVV